MLCSGGECCFQVWIVGMVAAGGFIMLVLILGLSVCICQVRARERKLLAGKASAEAEDLPEPHYASLQNLGPTRTEGLHPEPPAPQHTDYASVAEARAFGTGGASEPQEAVQEPLQEGTTE
ncbi:leukocyte-specific transcript 1 protein [Carettochelys insculpta]|uniref:leukocyte-specific transcript 1 protein n=1 Tax=Carettochelys insculpta TaxID=44489 RepID=UPI003EBA75F8